MSKPVSIPYTFAAQSGPIPLSELDANFSALSSVANDVSSYSTYLVDTSGASNAITVATPTNVTFSLAPGVELLIQVANQTSLGGGVTVSVNGGGAKSLISDDGGSLPQIIQASQIIHVVYDGTSWRSLTPYAGRLTASYFASGIAALPGISFAASTGTGLYNTGSTLGFSAGGNSVGTVSANGNWIVPASASGDTFSVNGAAINQSGSFVGTFTGLTTAATATVDYTVNGNTATLFINFGSSAVSNSTSFTMSGVPARLQPTATNQLVPVVGVDNGNPVSAIVGVNAGSGTMTFYRAVVNATEVNFSASGWTASGSKGVSGTFTYPLN